MSSTSITSVLDARTQTFPILTEAQIKRVRAESRVRQVHAGEILFRPGDTNVPFFVMLSGRLDIVQQGLLGERLIVTHAPGEFTGEVTMISGQRCLVLGRVTEDGEFLEMPAQALRSLIGRDAELSELFMRAFILRRLALINQHLGNVVILGSRHSSDTLRLREFLSRNGYPHCYVDLDVDQTSQELLDRFSVTADEIPVVICGQKTVLRHPTPQSLADCLGLNVSVNGAEVHDVIVVGAGPAGLAAAVYAASEGLDCLVVEANAPGGQAGSSSKIENYLGFPTGISGQELAARATHQAQKFGARMMVAHSVARLNCDVKPYRIVLDDDSELKTRTIIIATGAQYNKPNLANLPKFEGRGVYYGATFMESQLCEGDDVIVIGGGNSAGQAAVFLSQTARKVFMLVRSGGLAATMSRYLIDRITRNPGIEVHYNTEIVALNGANDLESVQWLDKDSGEKTTRDIRHVFIMAGASPRTDWLSGCLVVDRSGFILTGRDLDALGQPTWQLARRPQMLETSLPGVFAVGDVRSGNVKRVASAVGEGSIAVHLVHRTLAEM